MTAKEYLGQAYKIECEIRVKQTELEAMRSALHGRGVRYEGIGGQPADNELEKAICRVLDREREINRAINRLVKQKLEIAAVIRSVPDVRLRELLVRRYLDFERWEHISSDMHLEIRWLFRLHDKALREVSKALAYRNSQNGYKIDH